MLYPGRPRCGEGLRQAGWRRLISPLALAASTFLGSASAQQRPDLVTPDVLRVCSDPATLPFSNRAGEGFENRIAAVLAHDLKSALRYCWLPQGPGFVRNTLGAKLCD